MIDTYRINDLDWAFLTSKIQIIITNNKKITNEEISQEILKKYPDHDDGIVRTAIKSSRSFLEAHSLYLSFMNPLSYGDEEIEKIEERIFVQIQRTGIKEAIIQAAIRKGRGELKKRAFELMADVANRRVSNRDRGIPPHELASRIGMDEFRKPINKKLFNILIVVTAAKLKDVDNFHNKNLRKYEERTCGAL